MSRPHLRPGDKILVAVIACALIAGGAWLAWQATRPASGLVAVCQSKDGFYRVDSLDVDAAYTVYTESGYNNVTISAGTVDVTSADCSNQVCVDTAPISQPGEQIVCLPHGMVVEVARDADDVAPLS